MALNKSSVSLNRINMCRLESGNDSAQTHHHHIGCAKVDVSWWQGLVTFVISTAKRLLRSNAFWAYCLMITNEQATLMVGNPTICNIRLIVGNIHDLIVGLVGVGLESIFQVIARRASIWWTVSELTRAASHEKFPWSRRRSEIGSERSSRLQYLRSRALM